MSIGSIRDNDAVLLAGVLGGVVALVEPSDLVLLHVPVFLSLPHRHLHSAVGDDASEVVFVSI